MIPERETFVRQGDKSTIVRVFFFCHGIHSNEILFSKVPITLSNEQFDQLLSRVGNSNKKSSSIANPAALGLGGFALTTFLLSVFNAGDYLINHQLEPVVLPVGLFYGGLAQFLAGMWEFRANNVFGATAFTSYGAFWMSFAAYVHLILPQIKFLGNVKKATGLFLLGWFIFTLIMNIAAVKVSRFLFLLFSILNITFLLLIIGNLANYPLLINIGGWFGIVTSIIAWYGCAATVINATFKKQILPLGVCA